MDILKLDPITFEVTEIFTKFDECVWTDRFSTTGEFEITSYDPKALFEALPLNSFLGISETYRSVMMVERHTVERDEAGTKIGKVSGNSFEAILKHRFVGNMGGFSQQTTVYDDDGKLILSGSYLRDKNSNRRVEEPFPTGSPPNVFAHVRNILRYALNGPSAPSTWTLPGKPINFAVESSYSEDDFTSRNYSVDYDQISGTYTYNDAYSIISNLLDGFPIFIMPTRPGIPYREVRTTPYKAGLLITRGVNRQFSLIFDTDLGHFDSYSFISSIENLSHMQFGVSKYSSNISPTDYKTPWAALSKNQIRMSFYTDEDHAKNYTSDERPNGPTVTDVQNEYRSLRYQNLKDQKRKSRPLNVFSGKLSSEAPYKITRDYELGDLVGLNTDIPITYPMRITEQTYIITSEGESTYPSFEVYEDPDNQNIT